MALLLSLRPSHPCAGSQVRNQQELSDSFPYRQTEPMPSEGMLGVVCKLMSLSPGRVLRGMLAVCAAQIFVMKMQSYWCAPLTSECHCYQNLYH